MTYRRRVCGQCGDAVEFSLPSRTWRHTAERVGGRPYDHAPVLAAPSEAEQDRIDVELYGELDPHVHRGQHGSSCPECSGMSADTTEHSEPAL